MSGDRVQQRLADISEPIAANASHLGRGNISDGLIFDAVRIRLLEVGEAVKALRPDVTATEPDIPLTQIARMRDHPAHRFFDASHASSRPPSNTICPSWPPPSPDSSPIRDRTAGRPRR